MDAPRKTLRKTAGKNKSLPVDFTWPEKFGEGTSNMNSKMSHNSSHNSQVSLQRKRFAIEMEKKRQALEKEKLEIENSMRLLQMENDLENARFDAIEEIRSHRSQSHSSNANMSIHTRHENDIPQCLYPEVIVRNDELSSTTEESDQELISKHAYVSEWVRKSTVYGEEEVGRCESIIFPKTDEPSVKKTEIEMLCQTISDAIKTATQGVAPLANESRQDMFLARQVIEKDFLKFDGNPAEWPLFYQQYQRISKLCGFTNEEKMSKLQKCLIGEAKSAVAGMMLTSENIDLVIETLQLQFGRPDYIIEVIISKIKQLPILKEKNVEKLIQFSNEVNNLVTTMETLNSKGHMENPHLIRDLVNKLPDMIKLKWGEKVSESCEKIDLRNFSKFMRDIAKAACYVSYPIEINVPAQTEKHIQKIIPIRKHERVFSTSDITKKVCSYCELEHEEICSKLQSDGVDERWKNVTKKKLCFICLKRRHQKFRCNKKKRCLVDGCQSFHHPLLHKSSASVQSSTNLHIDSILTTRGEKSKILLRTIPIKMYGPEKVVEILALCDEASTVTIIDKEVLRNLGLNGMKEALCLQWTSDIISRQENSEKLNLKISKKQDGAAIFTLMGVRSIENLSLPAQSVNMDQWKSFSHLKNLPIENIHNEKPLLLIGQDNIKLIAPSQVRNGPENVPVATKCKLGWSLHGPIMEITDKDKDMLIRAQTLHICNKEDDNELLEMLKRSFTTEDFGIRQLQISRNPEDDRALAIMKRTIKRKGDRFEIGLLWNNEDKPLPESKCNAMQRLKCMERKCMQNKDFAKEYQEKIKYYIENGYARKLSRDEAAIEGPRTWYLPHFGVVNTKKPGKLRLVFDAAAKSSGLSLNDFLLPGPDLLQSLVAILWKFRERRIGFCGDAKDMFHQVLIRDEDRCAQRFLWRDLNDNKDPDVYEMMVMVFGSKCSPACAQFVKNHIAEEHAESPEILNAIIKKFYVDDYLDSKDSEEEAIQTILEIRRTLVKGGFNIVNWMTNSAKVREKLGFDLLVKKLDEGSTHRVLGLWWNSKEDEFLFKINKNTLNKPFTKREVLKSLMSIFDPLGFVASFTIEAKILMQDIWRSGIDWDDELSEDLGNVWSRWIASFQEIETIRIPRCYSINVPEADNIEIHSFCDSSQKAYACVVYLRVKRGQQIDVSFIAAKTKVAPLKLLSIPRLELQAAVMSSRLTQAIKNELELSVNETFYWTDSKCVLCWIRGDVQKYKQFVAHRVEEIHDLTEVSQWKWIPTDMNVSDEATKKNNSRQKIISDEWFKGPGFLKNPKEEWPREKEMDLSETVEQEFKKTFLGIHVHPTNDFAESLPDVERFSKWLRLIRSTAWMLRFVKKVKSFPLKSKELSVEELNNAEELWIKKVQQDSYKEEIELLKDGGQIKKGNKIESLCPRLSQGFLIVGGRTDLAPNMEEQTKKHIILHPKHRYTQLLIRHFHEKFKHQGVNLVLNELRQRFWIVNGRAAVKFAFFSCQYCKNRNVKPVPPIMGQLPRPRLTPNTRAFVNVGLDYFGPFYVTVGRRKEKRWGVLFTCLAVRAIHLEISHTLDSDSCLMAIKRMIARRGKPKTIFCDNGTNFRGADNEIRKAKNDLDNSAFINSLTSEAINFKFNPAAAPHMGGVWERLIGSVKKVIGKILYGQSLKDETLQTLFAEAENIVNSRPLTVLSTDPTDLEPLTPNHFLTGFANNGNSIVELDPDSSFLRREWRKAEMFKNSFWNRWLKEYLPTLNKRNKWTMDQVSIKENDIVVMVDDEAPRHKWKLGKIVQTYPGPDGRIRVVDVKMGSSIYRRPVVKICKLELEPQ